MDRYSLRFGSAIAQQAYDRAYHQHMHRGHQEAVKQALIEALRARDRLTAVVTAVAAC